MEESGPSMRSSPQSRNLGEMTIKVPAPFAGISDLGFTAQYRAQNFNDTLINDIVILLNDGAGGFDAPTFLQGSGSLFSSALGDLDGDGQLDLVTS